MAKPKKPNRRPVLPFLLSWLSLLVILILSLLFSQPSAERQGSPHGSFIFNATELPSEEDYDYIIVGGGTSGCPLAATLSQKYKVLVLERGGHTSDYPNLATQEGFLSAITQVDVLDSPAEAFTSVDGVPNARGRVLGGSSAINAGFYSRGDHDFFSQSGFSWDFSLVNKSYEWVERSVVFHPELRIWQSALRDGLLQANVTPYNGFALDHMIGTKIGGTTFDSTGRRHSSADLLNHANASNIKVALHANVERVRLTSLSGTSRSSPNPIGKMKKAAIGVVYRDTSGKRHHAVLRAKGEVILCAGAIGSPQLLLLSGIGPRPYLSSWGIPVSHHLPFVGDYMYDNPRNGISIVPPFPLGHSLIQVVGITRYGSYLEAASNIVPFLSPPHSVFLHNPPSSLYLSVATIMQKIKGPLSFGSLRLASTNVMVPPVVRFNYFSDPLDLTRCVQGMRIIGEILRGAAMEEFKMREWRLGSRDFRYVGPALPVNQTDDGLMEDFCRRTVTTIWHYHGGCVAGKVVDEEHRVLGVDGLRIVDGSTFSISPGTNPQATVMMMGRYVGLKMLKERRKRSGDQTDIGDE